MPGGFGGLEDLPSIMQYYSIRLCQFHHKRSDGASLHKLCLACVALALHAVVTGYPSGAAEGDGYKVGDRLESEHGVGEQSAHRRTFRFGDG